MSFKEWNAAIMATSAMLISAWVGWDAMQGGVAQTVDEAAWKMLWAIGYVLAFNIVVSIVLSILVSMASGEALRDEAADERDREVSARAMRNGYFLLSIGVGAVLVVQALGLDPVLGPYALFAISMAAGAVFAASQLIYYRLG